MSDYTQTTDFSTKDSLTTGDPEKVILGEDLDVELSAISTAIASKLNSSGYTASDVLTKIKTVDGAGSGLDADSVDAVGPFAAGTFSPTDSGHSGVVTDVTSASGFYVRIGTIVIAAVNCSVAASGSGTGSWDFTLPVASNLAAGSDLVGFVKGSFGDGKIDADTTNNTASCNYISTSVGTHVLVKVFFMYQVK